jgi:hypothetical protein
MSHDRDQEKILIVKDQILFNLAERPAEKARSPMNRLTDR